jgi:hypothetical protein
MPRRRAGVYAGMNACSTLWNSWIALKRRAGRYFGKAYSHVGKYLKGQEPNHKENLFAALKTIPTMELASDGGFYPPSRIISRINAPDATAPLLLH